MKNIIKLFIIFCLSSPVFAIESLPRDLKSDKEPFNSNILPEETIIYENIADHAEFLIVFYPDTGKRYKIRPGIGCLRALLDPSKNIQLNLIGLGEFVTDSKNRDFPYLHIKTRFHKVSCKVLSVDNYIKPDF